VFVDSGIEALARLDTESFDLFLVDFEMPELDGCSTVRRMRVHDSAPIRELPVIALTAHVTDEYRDLGEQAGMNGFLSKPYGPEELSEVMQRALATPAEVAGGEAPVVLVQPGGTRA
jgi:CheY-like chemotaxis protein